MAREMTQRVCVWPGAWSCSCRNRNRPRGYRVVVLGRSRHTNASKNMLHPVMIVMVISPHLQVSQVSFQGTHGYLPRRTNLPAHMPTESLRAQVQAHWRAFDALADSQSGGNEAIIRALDIFAGARGAFTAAGAAEQRSSGQVGDTSMRSPPDDLHRQQVAGSRSLPRGNANSGDDGARRSYLRAEDGLAVARDQLTRNEETLKLMAEEVEAVKQCIGSRYNTEAVETRQERKEVRAQASLQVLDRGDVGCLMSPVDMARAMSSLLRMHQSEFEMQETVVCGVGYDSPGEILTAYRAALDLRPYMDELFLSQVQEVRELSEELEHTTRNEHAEKTPAGT